MPRHLTTSSALRSTGALLGATLVALLALPLVALALSTTPADLRAGAAHPMFLPALLLSLKTTLISLAVTVTTGAPLAWWLATSSSRLAQGVELLVELPIVIPPAVIGVALLQTWGRQGLLGGALAELGVGVPFTAAAVVLTESELRPQ